MMTWTFLKAGFYPKHLPDEYIGTVKLSDTSPPPEVEGVWWHNGEDWIFWVPEWGGDLTTLTGLKDYMVLVSGACEWEIELPFSDTNYYLMLPKERLFPYLTAGMVAQDWWRLTDIDRRELAKKIVGFWSVPIGPTPYLIKDETQYDGGCGYSTAIRYCIFDGRIECDYKIHYYRSSVDFWVQMLQTGRSFGLPFYVAGVTTEDYGHYFCALQVGLDPTLFESWLFFEYEDIEMLWGHQHMPRGSHVKVYKLEGFDPRGHPIVANSGLIAEWNAPKLCCDFYEGQYYSGDWRTPTSHGDPQMEWSVQGQYSDSHRIENAYDGNTEKRMAMANVLTESQNLERYGDYWSGWLELYWEPMVCDRVRAIYLLGNAISSRGNVEFKIRCDGEWQTVYSGIQNSQAPPLWHTVHFNPRVIDGMGFRFERKVP